MPSTAERRPAPVTTRVPPEIEDRRAPGEQDARRRSGRHAPGAGHPGEGATYERRDGGDGEVHPGHPSRAHRLPRWELDVPLDFYLWAMDALGA